MQGKNEDVEREREREEQEKVVFVWENMKK